MKYIQFEYAAPKGAADEKPTATDLHLPTKDSPDLPLPIQSLAQLVASLQHEFYCVAFSNRVSKLHNLTSFSGVGALPQCADALVKILLFLASEDGGVARYTKYQPTTSVLEVHTALPKPPECMYSSALTLDFSSIAVPLFS